MAQVALARRLLAIIYGAPAPPIGDWLRPGADDVPDAAVDDLHAVPVGFEHALSRAGC